MVAVSWNLTVSLFPLHYFRFPFLQGGFREKNAGSAAVMPFSGRKTDYFPRNGFHSAETVLHLWDRIFGSHEHGNVFS